MDKKTLADTIAKLKEEKEAIILAHFYQMEEIQDMADVVGDSLELSRKAAATDARTIVFCGVRFMAETANILSPEKNVLLPVMDSGCPLADMIEPSDVENLRKKHPNSAVICYINSSAEVKAVSDYCCTSSNAVGLVRNIPEKKVIFIPDKNLGSYVAKSVPEKTIVIWDGYCLTHHRVTAKDVDHAKKVYPDAPVLVHPECIPEVVEKADFVGSTSGIIKYSKETKADVLIIGTEMGIIHRLKQDSPHKKFFLLSPGMICPNMKKIKPEDVLNVLRDMSNKIVVQRQVAEKAGKALNRMLEYV